MPHSQNPLNPCLLAFKPRQVLLSSNSAMEKTQIQTLKPHQRTLLLRSIAQFLQRNAFSKTLKKFRVEAQIQEDGSKGSPPDLEELFCKYLEMCDHAITSSNGEKVAEVEVDDDSKKKKKRSNDSDNHPTVTKSEAANKSTIDVGYGSQLESSEKKHKKKKKKGEVDSKSLVENLEHHSSESLPGETKKTTNDVSSECNRVTDAETEDGTQDKKKKKHGSENKPNSGIPSEDKDAKSKKKKKEVDDSVHDHKTSNEDALDKESKGSKKRKRMDSEANDSQPADGKTVEESKRGKKEGLEDAEGIEQTVTINASVAANTCADKESEENGKNSAIPNCVKGQSNGSAQPKKPFQRVNVEEVVFIDKRLEDNSYWAKDGAESGYGAKAQDVLGQVRGRDFRHEKTKKKRGTYRGGQIDLQSHSVKFNYSDDE